MTAFTRRAALLVLLLALGCASGGGPLDRARGMFLRGEYEAAGRLLEDSLPSAGRNRLLYLLEAGSSYHYARLPDRARACLERADELARILSYVSVSEEGAALLFDDRLKPYRAPEYERFLLLYLLAIEHFTAGEVEQALVELNRIIEFSADLAAAGRPSPQPLALYLSALCYLRFGEYDNARRDFVAAARLRPGSAAYARAAEEAERLAASEPVALPHGWVLAFVETGLAPHRVPAASLTAIPRFVPTWSPFNGARPSLRVDGGSAVPPLDVLDVSRLARSWLEKRMNAYLAREVGSVLAKRLLAEGVGELLKSKDAEKVAFAALLLSRSPDLRSWRNLPERITVFCLPLPPGTHHFELSFGAFRGYNQGKEDVRFRVEAGRVTTVHTAKLR